MLNRFTLRVKLTFLTVTMVIVGCYGFARYMTNGLSDLYEQLFGLRVETAAVIMAQAVEGQLLTEDRQLQDFSQGQPLEMGDQADRALNGAYVYRVELVRWVGLNEVEHLIGLGGSESELYAPPGKREHVEKDHLYVQTENGHSGIRRYGRIFMVGWAPIMKSSTQIGVLAVYVDPTDTLEFFNRAQIAILMAMGLIIVLSGIVAYRFASVFEKSAVTDGLMQLYNQRYFKQRLEQEVSRASRHKHPLTLVMLDIDHFKKINDTWGHATGDIVLRLLGKWVKERSRKTDVSARYGGEEVAIILTDTAIAGGQLFAERLREFVADQLVKDPEENAEFKISISVGCAQWERGMTYLDLIRAADTALYHSKRGGRNRVSVYHEDLLPRPEKKAEAAGAR